MKEEQKPVVEEVGPYYVGMVIASKEDAENTHGGVDPYNYNTGKKRPELDDKENYPIDTE